MAISLETINVGLENESTGSDSLFTAFNKIQNNFTTLSETASQYDKFNGGRGIQTSQNPLSGTVTITNSGVVGIIAGTGITTSTVNGNVTISVSGNTAGMTSGVTNVAVSSNTLTVTNSPIISSGIIKVDLPSQGLVPGEYVAPTISVDEFGRITQIASTESAGTVTSVAIAPGDGISVEGGPITADGVITIKNTGVTKLTAGTGIELSGNSGEITIASSATGAGGSVQSINIESESLVVTGGPITNTGSIRIELPSVAGDAGNIRANSLTSNTYIKALGNANVVANLVVGENITGGGDLTISGNASILGNFSVSGTTTFINSTTVTINDKNIILANNAADSTEADGSGITINGAAASMQYANVSNSFVFSHQVDAPSANITDTINAGHFAGNGALITHISAAAVEGTLGIPTNSYAATVSTSAQPNITSVGTLASTSLQANANLTLSGSLSQVTGANYMSATTVSATYVSGSTVTAGWANIGNVANIGNTGGLYTVATAAGLTGNALMLANSATLVFGAQNNDKFIALGAPATQSTTVLSFGLPNSAGNSNVVLSVSGGQMYWRTPAVSTVPATSSSTGLAGQIAYDTTYVYICVASNTWKRAALSTW